MQLSSYLLSFGIYAVGYFLAYVHIRKHIRKVANGKYLREDKAINLLTSLLSWILLVAIYGAIAYGKIRRNPIDWEKEMKW